MSIVLKFIKKYLFWIILWLVGSALPIGYIIVRCWLGFHRLQWTLFYIHPDSWMTCFVYWATVFLACVTGAVIWDQGTQLKKQNQLNALIDLYAEWDGTEMLEYRDGASRALAKKHLSEDDLNYIEVVLEFFEKVSTLVENGTLDANSVWQGFGWYLVRYYYYSKEFIEIFRTRWTTINDPTLYENIGYVYKKLMAEEIRERNNKCTGSQEKIDQRIIEKEYDNTKDKFLKQEKYIKSDKGSGKNAN